MAMKPVVGSDDEANANALDQKMDWRTFSGKLTMALPHFGNTGGK